MKNPEYKIIRGEGGIVVGIDEMENTNLIIKHLTALNVLINHTGETTNIVIMTSNFNGSLDRIRTVLSEHDDNILHITQFLSLDDVLPLLPEISSIADHNHKMVVNMDSDKFIIDCFCEDGNRFDGIGLHIVKTFTANNSLCAYLNIYVNTIHELRKLNLLGLMDCIKQNDHSQIIIPGFVFKPFPLIL